MPRPGTSGESYLQDGASNTLPCAALKAPDCLGYLRAGIEGPMAITVKAFIRPDDAVSPIRVQRPTRKCPRNPPPIEARDEGRTARKD